MSLISLSSAVLFLVVGLLLLLKTGFFMEFIGFVLGVLLVLYGLLQLYVAVRNSKGIRDRFWFFLIPALIFVAGILFCFFPKYNISVLCIVFGVCLMLLGASEILMSIKVRALAKRLQAAAQAEAERMQQNQQNIVVEAIEPEESDSSYSEGSPATYASESSEDIGPDPEADSEAEDETYTQEGLGKEE